MGADAVHGLIEKKMKKSATILTFQDFFTLCQSASKSIQAVQLQIQDFYVFEVKIRSRQTKNLVLFKLGSLCEVRFVKRSDCMYYRESFETEELQQTPFLKAKTNVRQFLNAKEGV